MARTFFEPHPRGAIEAPLGASGPPLASVRRETPGGWRATVRTQADRPSVLVIDDDEGTRETFAAALSLSHFRVTTAASGAEGIRTASDDAFDLILLDVNLGDMSGVDVMRAIGEVRSPRVVVISGFLTVGTAVEAMKLGAVDVIEKPVDAERLAERASALLDRAAPSVPREEGASIPPVEVLVQPRSAAERWARYVLRGCAADNDFKTLESWAHEIGVSYTTLCTTCRIMGVRPLDARDFARLLRALRKASGQQSPPEVFLDVCDARTVRGLSVRAGIDLEARANPASLHEFLRHQRFVPLGNEGLQIIQVLLRDVYAVDRADRIDCPTPGHAGP